MRRWKKRYIALAVSGALAVCLAALILTLNLIVVGTVRNEIGGVFAEADGVCAVVLGAKVHEGGELSDMLRDRMDTAIALYKEGKVSRLLLSGDGSGEWSEVRHMKLYALENGVPEEALLEDPEGYSTYETMWRASEVYSLEKVIVVTQKYHLYRAMYIARDVGLEAKGASADLDLYSGQLYRDIREVLARIKDFGLCIFN